MNKLLAILVALFAVNSFAEAPVITFEYDQDGSAQCTYTMNGDNASCTCTSNIGWTVDETEVYMSTGGVLTTLGGSTWCGVNGGYGSGFSLLVQDYVVKVRTIGPKFVYDNDGGAQCVVVANGESADHIECAGINGWVVDSVVVKVEEDGLVVGRYNKGDFSNIVYVAGKNSLVNVYAHGPQFVYETEGSAQCQYVAADGTKGTEDHFECSANDGYKIEKIELYDKDGTWQSTQSGDFNNIPYAINYTYKVYAICSDCYHVSRYSNDNVDYDINGEEYLTAKTGTKIEVKVTPKPGYEVDKVSYETCDGVDIGWTPSRNDSCSFIMPGCPVRLNADVSVINYSIVYNLDGASSNENPSNYTVENKTVILKTPIKSGYGFAGWYSDKDFTNKVEKLTIDKVQELAVDKKVTLYAMWDKLIVAESGCYKLSTADDLYQFAQVVAGSHKYIDANQKACGSMQNDIVVNENVLAQFDENGKKKSSGNVSGFKAWTPIGSGSSFLGKFYGNGYAVKGLYFDGSGAAGLFGYVGETNIQKSSITVVIDGVGIEDSYIKAGVVGGIVGNAWHAEVTNSYNKGIMIGESAGGIVGFAAGVKVKNAYNTGFLKGTRVGGIAGDVSGADEVLKNSVVNSYNVGSLTSDAVHPYIGGIVGYKGVNADYEPQEINNFALTEENEASFHNGTVAIALHDGADGSVWAQYVGHDGLPVLAANGSGEVKFDVVYVYDNETSVDATHVYGTKTTLPGMSDKSGFYVEDWHKLADFTDDAVAEIAENDKLAAGENGKVTFYAKMVRTDYGAITIAADRSMATISGTSDETVSIESDVVVDNVEFTRTFNADVLNSIVLPFDVPEGSSANAQFYSFSSVSVNAGTNAWEIHVETIAADQLKANTPYLLMPTDAALAFDFNGKQVTLKTGEASVTLDDWRIVGTYSYKAWPAEELGKLYGLAGQAVTGINAGQFVRLAYGADIYPMRAYLVHETTPAPSGKPRLNGSAAMQVASIDAPETIDIVIDEADGGVTAIGSLNTRTGELKPATRWFDLKGRRINKKASAKGSYYSNLKRAIVK